MATIYGNQLPLQQKREIRSEKPKTFGLNFPIGVFPEDKKIKRGYFSKESGVNLIKGNIKQLLGTFPGERVMLPSYGLDLRQFLFEPLDSDLFQEIREKIRESISKNIPNIEITRLSVVSLSEIGYLGVPGIKISLSFRAKSDSSYNGDLEIRVGA
jgi:phage baseplate assembly protein W